MSSMAFCLFCSWLLLVQLVAADTTTVTVGVTTTSDVLLNDTRLACGVPGGFCSLRAAVATVISMALANDSAVVARVEVPAVSEPYVLTRADKCSGGVLIDPSGASLGVSYTFVLAGVPAARQPRARLQWDADAVARACGVAHFSQFTSFLMSFVGPLQLTSLELDFATDKPSSFVSQSPHILTDVVTHTPLELSASSNTKAFPVTLLRCSGPITLTYAGNIVVTDSHIHGGVVRWEYNNFVATKWTLKGSVFEDFSSSFVYVNDNAITTYLYITSCVFKPSVVKMLYAEQIWQVWNQWKDVVREDPPTDDWVIEHQVLSPKSYTCSSGLCGAEGCTDVGPSSLYGFRCGDNMLVVSVCGCPGTEGVSTVDCPTAPASSATRLTITGTDFVNSSFNSSVVNRNVRVWLTVPASAQVLPCPLLTRNNTVIVCALPLSYGTFVVSVCDVDSGSCSLFATTNVYVKFCTPVLSVTSTVELGSTHGGTSMTLRGSCFGSRDFGTAVDVGGVRAVHSRWASDSEVVFVAPAGIGALLDLTLTIAMNYSAIATAAASYAPPVVSSVSTVPTVRGGIVTITGSEFGIAAPPAGALTVTVGVDDMAFLLSQASAFVCAEARWNSSRTITCVVREAGVGHGIGAFTVSLAGNHGSLSKSLSFERAVITSLSSSVGKTGQALTFHGSNLGNFTVSRGLVSVVIGGKFPCVLQCGASLGSFKCLTTKGSGVNLAIAVTIANVSAAVPPSITFTYTNDAQASISDRYPLLGFDSGGVTVTIRGTGFKSTSMVNFRLAGGASRELTPSAVNVDIQPQEVRVVMPDVGSEGIVRLAYLSVDNSADWDFFFITSGRKWAETVVVYPDESPTSGHVSVRFEGPALNQLLRSLPQQYFVLLASSAYCLFGEVKVKALLPTSQNVDSVGFVCTSPVHNASASVPISLSFNGEEFVRLPVDFTFVACHPGTFAPSIADVCRPCPFGSYSSSAGASACKLCPEKAITEKAGQTGLSSCICLSGSCAANLTHVRHTVCAPCDTRSLTCPRGGWMSSTCPTGTYLLNAVPNGLPALVVPCPNAAACVGGTAITTCVKGFTGSACTVCQRGYGVHSEPVACWECDSRLSWLSACVYFVLPVIYVTYAARASAIGGSSQLASLLKVLANHLVLTMSLSSLNFRYPSWLRSVLSSITLLGGLGVSSKDDSNLTGRVRSEGFKGIGSVLSFDCFFGLASLSSSKRLEARTALYAVYPLLLVACVLLFRLCWRITRLCRGKNKPDTDEEVDMGVYVSLDDDNDKSESATGSGAPHVGFWKVAASVTVIALNSVMPVTWSGLFSSLQCYRIGSHKVAATSADLGCFQGEHLTFSTAFTLPVLALYCIVYEALLFVWLRRLHLHSAEEVTSPLRFLSRGYVRPMYAWELVIMLRKILLSATTVLVVTSHSSTVMVRETTVLLIVSVALALHMAFHPFENKVVNRTEGASLVCAFLSLALGFYLETDVSSTFQQTIAVFIFIANISFVVGWFVLFLRAANCRQACPRGTK